jgi:hypothetical protein
MIFGQRMNFLWILEVSSWFKLPWKWKGFEIPNLMLSWLHAAWPSLACGAPWLKPPRRASRSGLVARLTRRASPPAMLGQHALGAHGWRCADTSPRWCTTSWRGSRRHYAFAGQVRTGSGRLKWHDDERRDALVSSSGVLAWADSRGSTMIPWEPAWPGVY